MSKYLDYLNANYANSLKVFSRWCEDHHRELLPVDFDYASIIAADDTTVLNNSLLSNSRLNLTNELNSEFSVYLKNPKNIQLRPGETLTYCLDESGAIPTSIDPIDPNDFKNITEIFSNTNEQQFTKYPKVSDIVGISGSTDISKQQNFLDEIKIYTQPKDGQGENYIMYEDQITSISSENVVKNMKNIKDHNESASDDSNKPKPK